MSRKQMSVKRRAAAYASGKRAAGTHSNADEGPLAEGWEDGYRAALRDIKKVGADLSLDISRELGAAFSGVVERAAVAYKEELEKL